MHLNDSYIFVLFKILNIKYHADQKYIIQYNGSYGLILYLPRKGVQQ